MFWGSGRPLSTTTHLRASPALQRRSYEQHVLTRDRNPERLLFSASTRGPYKPRQRRRGIGGDLEQVFPLINCSHQSDLSVPSRIPDRRLTCVPAMCARCQQSRNPPPCGENNWWSSIVSKQQYSGRARRNKNLRWSDSSP